MIRKMKVGMENRVQKEEQEYREDTEEEKTSREINKDTCVVL